MYVWIDSEDPATILTILTEVRQHSAEEIMQPSFSVTSEDVNVTIIDEGLQKLLCDSHDAFEKLKMVVEKIREEHGNVNALAVAYVEGGFVIQYNDIVTSAITFTEALTLVRKSLRPSTVES